MDRGELEDLDRETLVVRAQAAGIRRARILTRPELIDELLRLDPSVDAAQLRKSRGFFGRARDLVARVVERGLHLPDAADRIRTISMGTIPPPASRTEPQAMPTVTLAEIYAAQGHRSRAIETLRRVLEREPDHVAAQALLARLEDEAYVPPPPPLPPEPEIEPDLLASDDDDADDQHDDAEEARDEVIQGPADSNGEYEFSLAPASGADEVDVHAKTDVFEVIPEEAPVPTTRVLAAEAREIQAPALDAPVIEAREIEDCVAIPVDRDGATEGAGGRMYVRFSVSWSTLGTLLGTRPRGRFVVRAHVVTPAWDGPNSEIRDLVVDPEDGSVMLVGLPEPSVVRVAVGWLDGSAFVPIAHSPALEMARGRGLVIWTTKGAVPVVLDDPRAASIARALDASRAAAQAHP